MNNEEKILGMLVEMKQDITEMKQDITGMKQEITGMKQDITGIKQEVTTLGNRLENVEQGVLEIKQEIKEIKEDLNKKFDIIANQTFKTMEDVVEIKVTLEDHGERLEMIEECVGDLPIMKERIEEQDYAVRRLKKKLIS